MHIYVAIHIKNSHHNGNPERLLQDFAYIYKKLIYYMAFVHINENNKILKDNLGNERHLVLF